MSNVTVQITSKVFLGSGANWLAACGLALVTLGTVCGRVQSADPPPNQVGVWLPAQPWPVVAIHAALLPNGNVLHYTYPLSGAGTANSRVRVWNPTTGVITQVAVQNDIFCSGMCHLPDGRLLLTGGNDDTCEFSGLYDMHLVNPFTNTIPRIQDMAVARWYPTNIVLGDGSVMIFSGLNEFCGQIADVERYTPDPMGGNGSIILVPEAERILELYPRMHLLSNGTIGHVGPEAPTSIFDPTDSSWTVVDTLTIAPRVEGTSVLIPGEIDKVMVIGGFNSDYRATRTCEIIDFGAADPEWAAAAPMHFARGHPKPVILPDKTVLVIGGGREGLYRKPVLIPELYNPATNTWTQLPAEKYPRTYHSTALLLPNGRILSAGTDDGDSRFWAQQYKPAYLFKGPKPIISTWSTSITYADEFLVTSAQASGIESVCLIALSSQTHSVDFSQRYVGLPFTLESLTELRINTPATPELAPPGYYMLFIVNSAGVPSTARIIRLELAGMLAPLAFKNGMAGDLDANGTIDAADLVQMVSDPNPNDDSPADLTGDGIVDALDIVNLLDSWTGPPR